MLNSVYKTLTYTCTLGWGQVMTEIRTTELDEVPHLTCPVPHIHVTYGFLRISGTAWVSIEIISKPMSALFLVFRS